ncbi:11709_t:CDS:2 [Entrophospora sp. SA101]|nr:11709_t:CDS:2 [Entrophospora sp. SA101]CAJ0908142.1 19516_t:CDS:2 [Entrophospora sp. SA101]
MSSPEETTHHVTKTKYPGPNKEIWCWYQCMVKGGNVYQLATICEVMGAGGIVSIRMVQIQVPIIASSGAGNEFH